MALKEEGPTPSTTSNQIISLCQAVMDGATPPEALTRALTNCTNALSDAREDFIRQVEESGSDNMAALEEEIEDVIAAFDAYQSSLNVLAKFSHDRKKQHITNGIDELITATNLLLNALATYEDKELLASGPSDNQYVNLLIRMGQRLASGELDENIFMETIANAEKFMEDSLANASKEEDLSLLEEIASLKSAGGMHQDAIKLFKQFAATKNMQTLNEATALLNEASNRIKEGLMQIAKKRLESGPSKSTYINLVIGALKGFSEKAIPLESYIQTVTYFKNIMLDTHREFKKLSSVRAKSVQFQEETERIALAIQLQDEFVTELEKVQTFEDAAALLLNSPKFINAANSFVEAFQNIQELAERENKILCFRCQHYNSPESRSCEKCNATLPKLAESYVTSTFTLHETGDPSQRSTGDMPVTKEMHELFTAVNNVSNNEISNEEFIDVLNWMEQYVTNTEQNVCSYVHKNIELVNRADVADLEKQQIIEALEDSRRIVTEGSLTIREGLNLMYKFTEEPNKEYLMEGVRTVWQGFKQLYDLYQSVEAVKNSSNA